MRAPSDKSSSPAPAGLVLRRDGVTRRVLPGDGVTRRVLPGDGVTRRVPRRDRGERRVAELLEAAAETFAEAGYEGATMTAIAERAGASIGAVYQYFPNKEALGLALRSQYASELSARWTPLTTMETASVDELVERVFAVLFEFFAARPAFVPLLNAPFHYPGNPAQRVRLREDFATLFRKKKPALGSAEAFRVANVALNIIRAMYPMYAEARGKERLEVGAEFKRVVTAYLKGRLDG